MNRTILSIVIGALLVVTTLSMAFAMGGGNGRKGKFLYRKHCRTCHGVNASDLSPATKTQAEWLATFEDMSTIPCQSDWPDMSDADVNDIFTYLHDYAKDSPSPAKCS